MVEEGIREEGANSEITSNIVLQAVRKNKNFTRKRPNIQLVIIKIIYYFSTLLVDFLFDESEYPN